MVFQVFQEPVASWFIKFLALAPSVQETPKLLFDRVGTVAKREWRSLFVRFVRKKFRHAPWKGLPILVRHRFVGRRIISREKFGVSLRVGRPTFATPSLGVRRNRLKKLAGLIAPQLADDSLVRTKGEHPGLPAPFLLFTLRLKGFPE